MLKPACTGTSWLLLLAAVSAASAPASEAVVLPYSLTTSTTSVYSDVGATVFVSTNASWFKAGPKAQCSFNSQDTAFNSPALDKYKALKALNATVINGTHLSCQTVALDNAGVALLTVTMDGGNFSNPSEPIAFFPAVEIALDRRPYIFEANGGLIVRSSPKLAGRTLHISGALPAAASSSPSSGAAGAQPLLSGTVPGGGTATLEFSLAALPPTVLAELTVQVTVMRGAETELELTKTKVFHRAPPPTSGYNGSIWQVDHQHRGMLVNGWLPFVGVGWFHTGFDHPGSGVGDPTFYDPTAPRAQAEGASLVAEWGKHGHTLALLGQPGPHTLAVLDALQASGMHAMVTLPYTNGAPTNAKIDLSSPLWSASGGYLDQIKGNMSAVMGHPAVQAWYICDDCECDGHPVATARPCIPTAGSDRHAARRPQAARATATARTSRRSTACCARSTPTT